MACLHSSVWMSEGTGSPAHMTPETQLELKLGSLFGLPLAARIGRIPKVCAAEG